MSYQRRLVRLLSRESDEEATMRQLSLQAVRSEALFVSALQRSERPDSEQVRRAIARTVKRYGSRGCAARVAQEYGDHPECAADRMRWACQLVDTVYGPPRPNVGPAGAGRLARAA
jgi:hypothetical protein